MEHISTHQADILLSSWYTIAKKKTCSHPHTCKSPPHNHRWMRHTAIPHISPKPKCTTVSYVTYLDLSNLEPNSKRWEFHPLTSNMCFYLFIFIMIISFTLHWVWAEFAAHKCLFSSAIWHKYFYSTLTKVSETNSASGCRTKSQEYLAHLLLMKYFLLAK